jgi:diadenosine tetraphosphate (Ap4A) HIT family hydrolase
LPAKAANNMDCVLCINDSSVGTAGVEPERILKSYTHWWLVLQQPAKREATVQAAGMLVAKRHISGASQSSPAEFGEVPSILHDASKTLCDAVGTSYTQQTRLGFNEGADAGQTMDHVHLHVLPVSESDPPELKIRGGIGGAFEALRTTRLNR